MNNEILVTGYIDPDLDGFACIQAYSYLLNKNGKKALPVIFGNLGIESEHVVSEYNLQFDLESQDPRNFGQIILVDSSELDNIDKKIDPLKVVEIIDHRKINMVEKFPNAKVQIELVGAAATLVAEKFRAQKIDVPKNIAILLYGAIISNTLNFQAKVTTERDIEIANWLKNNQNLDSNFSHKMFLAKSDFSGEKLKETLWHDFANFKNHDFGGKKIGIAQIEMIEGFMLAKERKEEILAEIKSIMEKYGLDIVFLTIIDLEANQNILIAPNREIEELLEKVLNVKFENQIAVRPGLIMRKEIVPLLKEALTS